MRIKNAIKAKQVVILLLNMWISSVAFSQKQLKPMDRGLICVPTSDQKLLISWRSLVEDPQDMRFELWRSSTENHDGHLIATIEANQGTNFVDPQASVQSAHVYKLVPLSPNGRKGKAVQYAYTGSGLPYHQIALQTPPGYSPNDAGLGDLDGDGQYDLVLHQTGVSKDNSHAGFTDPPIFQAYTLTGKLLWQISLGKNIREGAHYSPFLVYDFDGDGRSEFVVKTADGTVDGVGHVIGDPTKDWRNSTGYILSGPEYLTIFDGRSGKALFTAPYSPARHPTSLEPTTQELKKIWGDGYGNRMDRFLACVAYLDGKHPSIVMCRGYYTKTVLTAWDFTKGELKQRWVFDSDEPGFQTYAGQGNHNLTVADVDEDGKDEIVYGAMVVDDDGKGLYSTGLGHGDALHVSDFDPSRKGLEVFGIQERFDDAGMSFRDARTGKIWWKKPSIKAGEDGEGPARGLCLDIDPRYPGAECWALGAGMKGVFSVDGQRIAPEHPSCNMGIFWDGDLLRELLDGTFIDKWDTSTLRANRIFDAGKLNCVSNNGTKRNPVLSADIWGDWREEVIYRTGDNQNLRIFTSGIFTPNRLPCLMQDRQYRLSIVWQNVGYNQPPHTSYFIGHGMKIPIQVAKNP
jgi:rhamnogalacturonan endolyase